MSALLVLTALAIYLHLYSTTIATLYQRIPPTYKQHVDNVLQYVGPRPGSPASEKRAKHDESTENSVAVVTIRNVLCIVYLALSLILSLVLLI